MTNINLRLLRVLIKCVNRKNTENIIKKYTNIKSVEYEKRGHMNKKERDKIKKM